MANTWVSSLDTILDAYEEIGEKIPSFLQYQGLFERNLGMRAALDLYYCDILEFHYHALQFLSRPGEFCMCYSTLTVVVLINKRLEKAL